MSDYQAQTVTECLSTWCSLMAGHGGGHTDIREPRTAREELARIIRDGVGVWRTPLEAADAIQAAGYGKLADAWDEGYMRGQFPWKKEAQEVDPILDYLSPPSTGRNANPYRSES